MTNSNTSQIVIHVPNTAVAMEGEWQNVINMAQIDGHMIAADHLVEQGPPSATGYTQAGEVVNSEQYFVPLYQFVASRERRVPRDSSTSPIRPEPLPIANDQEPVMPVTAMRNEASMSSIDVEFNITDEIFGGANKTDWTTLLESIDWIKKLDKKIKVWSTRQFQRQASQQGEDGVFNIVVLAETNDYIRVRDYTRAFFGENSDGRSCNIDRFDTSFSRDGFEGRTFSDTDHREVTFTRHAGIAFHKGATLISIVPDHRDDVLLITATQHEMGRGNIGFLRNYFEEPSLVKFMTGETDRAGLMRVKFEKIVKERARTQIRNLESQIESNERYLRDYSSNVQRIVREMSEQRGRLEFLNQGGDKQYEKILADIDALPTLDKIKSVSFAGSSIVVYTDFLHFDGADGYEYELGEFKISVNIFDDSPRVTLENLDGLRPGYNSDGMHAPHVFNDGQPCFGNLEIPILKLFANYEVLNGMSIVVQDFLSSANHQDPAGKYYPNWKRVNETDEEHRKRLEASGGRYTVTEDDEDDENEDNYDDGGDDDYDDDEEY